MVEAAQPIATIAAAMAYRLILCIRILLVLEGNMREFKPLVPPTDVMAITKWSI